MSLLSLFWWVHTSCVLTVVSLRSVLEYYWHGPRLPRWNLKFQVTRDIMHKLVSDSIPQLVDDSRLSELDIYALAQAVRAKHAAAVPRPAGLGSYRALNIPVKQVGLDASMFKGAGVGESRLAALSDGDQQDGDGPGRMLPCEVVVAAAAEAETKELAGNRDILACRPVYDNEKIILYFHGGAYVLGSTASCRELVWRISASAGVRAMTVEYRLAPEHPFPAQVHDALIAYEFLQRQGFKPQHIILAGDSAGAHLALSLTHLLRLLQRPAPLGLVLLSPPTDMSKGRPSEVRNREHDFLAHQPITSPLSYPRLFYAPGQPFSEQMHAEMTDPLVSPLYGSFDEAPATLILAGSAEVLIDSITDLHQKIRTESGSDRVALKVHDDMHHAFYILYDREESKHALASIGSFVRDCR